LKLEGRRREKKRKNEREEEEEGLEKGEGENEPLQLYHPNLSLQVSTGCSLSLFTL
jgi:hypothetical protein